MPFNDGIPRTHSFSLTDFHEFDYCPFRFFVFHHLGKKYEMAEGSRNLALGSLLDASIKLFHKTKSYGQPKEYIKNLIQASCNKMMEKVAKQSSPSFYSAIKDFLNDDLCEEAAAIFINYYKALDLKIKPAIMEVGFCEWVIETDDPSTGRSGQVYKLWGGPDTLEMGEDGIPEVVDYKFRENIEVGKDNMDMDLMPKIYMLLVCNKLLEKGYKKARFVVRFWQDPKDDSFFEEFDLERVRDFEDIFKERIEEIFNTSVFKFCEKGFCKACKSDQRTLFLKELEDKKLIVINQDLLFAPGEV